MNKTTAKSKAPKTKKTTASAKSKLAASKSKKIDTKSKKSVAAKPIAVTKNPKNPKHELKKLNLVFALVYALQAAVIVAISKVYTLPITLGFVAPDTLQSTSENQVLAAAQKTLWDVNIAYFLAIILGVMAVAHLLAATTKRASYEDGLSKNLRPGGWLAHGISAGLLYALLAMFVGLQSLAVLLGLFGLSIAASIFAIGADKQPSGDQKRANLKHALSKTVLIWVILGTAIVGTSVYGMTSLGLSIYLILATALVFCKAVAYLVYLRYKKAGKWDDAYANERRYALLGLLAYSAITWQIYAEFLTK